MPRRLSAARCIRGSFVRALRPLEDRRMHAVPRTALRATPVPAYAMQSAFIALIAAAGVPDPRQQGAERGGIGGGFHAASRLAGDRGQPPYLVGGESRS